MANKNATTLAQLKLLAHTILSRINALTIAVDERTERQALNSASLSVATGAWATNADETTKSAGYLYYADAAVSDIEEPDNVNVMLDAASAAAASAAGMASFCKVTAGNVRLYAVLVPTVAINGTIHYIHGGG